MLNYILTWAATMGWHLCRIMTLRPAFRSLSDSGKVFFSFLAVYFGAGVLRAVLDPSMDDPYTVPKTLFSLFIYMVAILAVFERRHRSSALSAVVLGVFASADLLVAGGYLIGALPSVQLALSEFLFELVWTFGMVVQFNRQPRAVQRTGYRLLNHPELKTS